MKRLKCNALRRSVFNSAFCSLPIGKPTSEVKVVVVGGGLAGLSAANHLVNNGFKNTIVLEATERFGGRVQSKQFGDVYCELGAKWVPMDASKYSVYELMKQATGLQKHIDTSFNKEVLYVNTDGQKIDNDIPAKVKNLFRKLCMGIPLDEKYKSGCLHDLNNVHTYFQAETKNLLNAFEPEDREAAGSIFNVLIKDFSALLGCCLEHVNIEHITKLSRLHNVGPIFIPTGMDNVLYQITRDFDSDQLHIGKPVGEINWNGLTTDHQKSVRCMDGTMFEADHIICTLPLGVLKNFSGYMFKPMLPKEKEHAIKNLGFGSPVKIYFEYKRDVKNWFTVPIRPLWTKKKKETDLNWISQVYEVTNVPASRLVLEVKVGGSYYEEIEKLPDGDLAREVTRLLRKCLCNMSIPYPRHVLRSNWSSSACYLGGRPFFSTQSSLHDILNLATPLGQSYNLLFAGDATAVKGFGTVDGARLSGIREAERIIDFHNKGHVYG